VEWRGRGDRTRGAETKRNRTELACSGVRTAVAAGQEVWASELRALARLFLGTSAWVLFLTLVGQGPAATTECILDASVQVATDLNISSLKYYGVPFACTAQHV